MESDAFPEVDWDEVPLSELTSANVTYGVVQPGSPVSDGVPMIRVKNFNSHTLNLNEVIRISHDVERKYERTRVRAGDVLITVVGSVGQVAIVPPELTGWNIARAVALIRPKSPDLARWIAYFLRSPIAQHRMGIAANTTVQTTVNLKDLRTMPIPMPPETVRQGITDLLSALDDRIDLLRQTNTTLEAIAQALFKSWFVDFDPVHAKAEGRARQDGERSGQPRKPQASGLPRPEAEAGAGAEGAPEAMDAATAALFPSEFEQSELGPVPKGWRLTKVGEVADLVKGCSYKGAGLSDADGAYMFNLGCFNAKRIFATEKIKRYTGTYRERHAVIEGDLIVANTDMTQHRDILGRPLFVPGGYEPGFVSHHVFKVAPALPNAAQWKQFLFFAFQQPEFRERAVGYATGTTVLALARDSAEKCPIVDPGEALLTSFSELTTPLLSLIANNLQREKSLEQLRDTLLPRLISGKLRLPEATKAVDEEAVT